MIKKTIKYVDFNGVEREEDFYFNLSKSELARMQFEEEGDFGERIRSIIRAKDTSKIMELFEGIILKAYGAKSEDGKHFVKKARDGHLLADDFVTSPAYDELYFELIQDPEKFASFVNSLMPADLAEQVKKMQESGEIPPQLEGLM